MINEKKKSGKKDACYHKVKSRYSVWPSAYASGALVKCRKKGAKNWGKKSLRDDVTYAYTDFCHSIMELSRINEKIGGGQLVPTSTALSDPKRVRPISVSNGKNDRPKPTASKVVGDTDAPRGKNAAQRRAAELRNPVDAEFKVVPEKRPELPAGSSAPTKKPKAPKSPAPGGHPADVTARDRNVLSNPGSSDPKPGSSDPKPAGKKSEETPPRTPRTPGAPNPANVPDGSKPRTKLDSTKIGPVTKRGAHSYRGESGRQVRRDLAARRRSDKRSRRYNQFKDTFNKVRGVGSDVVKGGQSLARGAGNLYGGVKTVARGAAAPLADIVKTGYKASTALNKMRAKNARKIADLRTAEARGKIASSQADAAKYAAGEAQERKRTQRAVRLGRIPGGPGSPTNSTRTQGLKVPDVVGANDEFKRYRKKLSKLKSKEQRDRATAVAGQAFDNSVSMGEGYRQLGFLIIEKSAAWTRKAGKNPSGGLNAKGVASYRAQNPGSKLKTAVTTKPSKLKKGSKAAKRRKSFCARMKGMRARQKSSNNTGKDRLSLSLKKWNC